MKLYEILSPPNISQVSSFFLSTEFLVSLSAGNLGVANTSDKLFFPACLTPAHFILSSCTDLCITLKILFSSVYVCVYCMKFSD